MKSDKVFPHYELHHLLALNHTLLFRNPALGMLIAFYYALVVDMTIYNCTLNSLTIERFRHLHPMIYLIEYRPFLCTSNLNNAKEYLETCNVNGS